MNWIDVNDKLPKEGKYVLARHNRGTWFDMDDRHNVYRSEDEHGNNLVPYNWEMFGPDSFFGQTITHWVAIEST